ncbi:hypothetical protein QTP70_032741, partial [Hemibagrus guttatus]
NRKVLYKRKLTDRVVKHSMPPNRQSMSVLQMLKQRLKSNQVLMVRPRVQHVTPAVILPPVPAAQSHKPDNTQADNESIAEITDEYLLFLKDHRAELIDKVKNVVRIVDDLELPDEKAAIVRAQLTDQAMMRKLLEFTTSKRAAERLLHVLWEQADDVMEDLADDVGDDAGNDGADDNADAVIEDNIEQ